MTRVIHTSWLPFHFDGLALKWVVFVKHGQDAVIAHELVHIRQQTEVGLAYYLWKYLTDKRFRWGMEFEAYREGSCLSMEEAYKMADKYLNLWAM